MEPGFLYFLQLGIEHICDVRAYDHMLFLLALVAPYGISDWRVMLKLVTAFTLGHCLSLLIVGMAWLSVPALYVEIAIVISILLTSLINFLVKDRSSLVWRLEYLVIFVFGIIHGAGFSSYLRSMFFDDHGIVLPLLWFNIGIEIGQLLILSVITLLSFLVVDKLGIARLLWTRVISTLAFAISLYWLLSL